MTALYSYQGQEPQELPHRIRLSDGRSRTDSSTFTEEEIIDAGFTGPYERPEYNSEIETQSWNYKLKKWDTIAIPDEVFWQKLRTERNSILKDSDWSQLSDAPLTSSQKTAWVTYRQALRDLPANTEDPKDITYPLPPN
jgi:hypothetical protein